MEPAEEPRQNSAAGASSEGDNSGSESSQQVNSDTPSGAKDSVRAELERELEDWKLNGGQAIKDDPLLDSLTLLTRYYRRPFSADALRDGLPLVDHKLTPELFVRAASRAGLTAKVISRNIRTLNTLVLPTVLLMHQRHAVILSALDLEKGIATIICTESGGGVQDVPLEELEKQYLGYAIFVKPQFRYDERAESTLENRTGHWFWGTLTKSWRIYLDVLAASLFINIFALVSPFFIMNVYDRIVPNSAFESLWVLAVGVTVVYLFDLIMKGLRSYFIDIAGKKSDILLSSRIFEQVLGIKMSARPASVGAFAKNLQEFETIREFITSATITALIDLPFVIVFLVAIGFLGGWLVTVPIIAMALMLLTALCVQKPLRNSVEQSSRSASQKSATLVESLSGLDMIKVNGAEGELLRTWEKNIDNLSFWGTRSKMWSNLSSQLAGFITQFTTVGTVVFGVYLIDAGVLSVGALIATVMLSGRAMSPMATVTGLATRYNQTLSALQGLESVMSMPLEREEGKQYISRPHCEGALKVEQVEFVYPTDEERPVLKGIDIDIKVGEKVGIVGRIGSGKSTLERLMLGLYEPSKGSIMLDGVDIRQINPSDLRRHIGHVSQECRLFHGTVRDNIVMGAEYVDDHAIIQAAEVAGVTEFANTHPLGLDMPVAEGGSNISGGQRQSIALARALLLDPQILVLDEPCGNMDNVTENRIKAQLKAYCEDKTLILVTHRISLLDLVDRMIVMDQGEVVADGPKERVFEALRQGELKVS